MAIFRDNPVSGQEQQTKTIMEFPRAVSFPGTPPVSLAVPAGWPRQTWSNWSARATG